ncbi:hypothetical protein BU26DRAFT_519045 [Trematosphaeria pertusa]|uniref:Uncharacterized protein n=1 Tax=Trematosphaeria pertusa TaxID=390896 RepID=A0A6A6IF61_9PLEO|nr:uncharacterized protein BU26DRAFT_519045 [Trematosphaeria pertusa]KAF2248837.1 hypothetical protein BU26DRAFT_519045 [Trematosphaeria pertusa]
MILADRCHPGPICDRLKQRHRTDAGNMYPFVPYEPPCRHTAWRPAAPRPGNPSAS